MRPVLAGSRKIAPREVKTALVPSGEMCAAGQIIERLLDPVLAHLVEVRDQGDGNQTLRGPVFRSSSQRSEPQAYTDAAVEKRCRLHVEDVLMALLLYALPCESIE